MKNQIRKLRLVKSLTVIDLASKVGCNPMSIYRYETGRRTPDLITASKIAKALGVTVDELIGKKAG
jgi:DNA-binding XRE family transcriptional regulator